MFDKRKCLPKINQIYLDNFRASVTIPCLHFTFSMSYYILCHMSYAKFHTSYVTTWLSCVTYHMSFVTMLAFYCCITIVYVKLLLIIVYCIILTPTTACNDCLILIVAVNCLVIYLSLTRVHGFLGFLGFIGQPRPDGWNTSGKPINSKSQIGTVKVSIDYRFVVTWNKTNNICLKKRWQ